MSIKFLGQLGPSSIELPFFLAKVPAGFPSPAADHLESRISLDELFDIRAPHIYLVKIDGDSMNGAGLFSGDLVIVDRSRDAKHGDIIFLIRQLDSHVLIATFFLRSWPFWSEHTFVLSEVSNEGTVLIEVLHLPGRMAVVGVLAVFELIGEQHI